MTPDRWSRIREVFFEARRLDPPERDAYLEHACGNEPDVRARVEAILESDETPGDFLATPALGEGFSIESLDFAEPDHSGLRLGRYRIRSVIGRGGMGTVYLADQDSPPRRVALKVVDASLATANVVRRFEREAEALGRLDHPGIARIFEAGTAETDLGARPYFAMEFVEGRTLVEHVTHFALGRRERLEIFVRLCEAVQHAHQRGVIHRDLKPANVLVDATGQPKILDFGIARVLDSDRRSATMGLETSQVLGTLAYTSPEQISGDPSATDTRTDVYSLGVIGHEMLTGRLPFDARGRSIGELVHAIEHDRPDGIRALRREVGRDVEAILLKALEKDKERRYSSASELAADVWRHLRCEPVIARPAGGLYRLQRFVRRHRSLVAVAAVAIVATSAAFVDAIFARRLAENRLGEAEHARDEARAEARRAESTRDFVLSVIGEADPVKQGKAATMAELVRSAAQRLDTAFDGEPDVEADLRYRLGVTARHLGLAAEAERLFSTALEFRARTLGDDALLTLRTMNGLAVTLLDEGRSAEAETIFRELQARLARTGNPDPTLALNVAGNLACAALDQGRPREAETILRGVVNDDLAAFGPNDRRTLVARGDLARALTKLDAYDEARATYCDVIERASKRFDESDPWLLSMRNNFALLLLDRGHTEEAITKLEANFEARQKALGDRHPHTLEAMNNLASALGEAGRHRESCALLRRVTVVRGETLGERHPRTLVSRNNLAFQLHRAGESEEAEAIYREVLETGKTSFAPGHWEAAIMRLNFGRFLLSQSRFSEAEAELLQSFADLTASLGPDHSNTKQARSALRRLYEAWGKPSEAERF